MTTEPKPIRIAIVLNGQEFICHAVTLPFSLEGYPPVDLVLYGRQPEAPAPGLTINRLPDLHPEGFDLILDGQFLTAGMANFSPERLDNLVTGPAARFLKTLVCQLQELRQKQEINSGITMSATDALITITADHMIVGYNRGAEQMFGYTRTEALGQDLKLILPPPYQETHRGYVQRYLATREAPRARPATASHRPAPGRPGIPPEHLLFRGRNPRQPVFYRHHAGHYRI